MSKRTDLAAMAKLLEDSRRAAREVERLTLKHPDLTVEEAYLIQDEGIKLRLARGEKWTGYKMGLTSQAKRDQMGLHSPIYGILTEEMQIKDGGTFKLEGSIHPKIEPEIAFFIKNDLKGVPSHDKVLSACSGVSAAMEILDSRFVGFKYFSLPDVVADNSSSSHFVIGSQLIDPRGVDLSRLRMAMSIDGKVVQSALSDVISGGPINSVIQLCEILNSRGIFLKAGSIVLAGAATVAEPLRSGSKVTLEVEKLGSVSVSAI